MRSARFSLGLDFGTEAVRALLVGLRGKELCSATERYRHGQITRRFQWSEIHRVTEMAIVTADEAAYVNDQLDLPSRDIAPLLPIKANSRR
jgi:ribulose kinase